MSLLIVIDSCKIRRSSLEHTYIEWLNMYLCLCMLRPGEACYWKLNQTYTLKSSMCPFYSSCSVLTLVGHEYKQSMKLPRNINTWCWFVLQATQVKSCFSLLKVILFGLYFVTQLPWQDIVNVIEVKEIEILFLILEVTKTTFKTHFWNMAFRKKKFGIILMIQIP